MTTIVHFIVKARNREGGIVEEELSNRDQMSRWIKLLQRNEWHIISKNSKVVRI